MAANPDDLQALQRLLRSLQAADEDADEAIEKLRARYRTLTTQVFFAPGMIVQWKEGLRNRIVPDYGQPGIVVEVLEKPIFDSEFNSGTPYFREPLNLIVAFVDPDGDFSLMHLDSRRLTSFE